MHEAIPACVPGFIEGPCGKTTVFLHEYLTARAPSQPAFLRFNMLVQKSNVREIRSDMSKANRSHIMCVQPDVFGLFLASVGSFSDDVGWGSA
jgi:hypothetical protein